MMSNFGFLEIALIAIVALIVIGPKRLPAVAKAIGQLLGRASRMWRSVKEEANKALDDEADKDKS